MLPDIDSLAPFVRAAELRSLTKAAKASHIGLAAGSRRMALLEHRFRTTLFERSSRGVDLTPAGASLLPHARALLVEINQMQADLRDHAAGSKGALRILANTSVINEALPDDLAGFAQANPDVRLIVMERWSDEIARSLNAAQGDIGIVVEGVATAGWTSCPTAATGLRSRCAPTTRWLPARPATRHRAWPSRRCRTPPCPENRSTESLSSRWNRPWRLLVAPAGWPTPAPASSRSSAASEWLSGVTWTMAASFSPTASAFRRTV